MHALRTVVVLGLALGGASTSTWAADALFAPMANREFVSRPGPLLKRVAADESNARIELVAVRAEAVSAKSTRLALSLPGGIEVEAQQTGFQRMDSGNEVWVGRIDLADVAKLVPGRGIPLDANADSIIAVRAGNTVLANIRIGDALYRLMPVEKGAHALVEVDQTRFLPDEDAAAYSEMQRNSFRGDVFGGPLAPAKAISTIRVMVAFGASATANIGNEQQALDLAFTEANQALANTNTDIRFAQAGSIRFYTQGESSTYSTMLARLTSMSDGFYDAIGGQRDTNTADIVAYVAPQSSTLCGQAAGIATSSANAYFVISWSCLSGNWTFVHEAAHVVGARHDNDGTTSPFAYGHGYVMSSINRRTVMAVNNGPCSSCTRFPAFSSPNYTLSGVTIGTASFNDNTRVWRSRGPTVAAFR
jgi:peptidyl-Asp metalloendopeptidase